MLFLLLALAVLSCKDPTNRDATVKTRDIEAAARLAGLEFSHAERDSMLHSVNQNLESLIAIHEFSIENDIPPSGQTIHRKHDNNHCRLL